MALIAKEIYNWIVEAKRLLEYNGFYSNTSFLFFDKFFVFFFEIMSMFKDS